jgi:hypothetical protein
MGSMQLISQTGNNRLLRAGVGDERLLVGAIRQLNPPWYLRRTGTGVVPVLLLLLAKLGIYTKLVLY